MTETTHSQSPTLVSKVLWIVVYVFIGRIALGILGRILYEIGLLDIGLAIFAVVLQAVFTIGWPILIIYISISVTHKQSKDTAYSAPQSPADRLPDTDARAAHEFSDGRGIVPQSLAERDEIEYELEKERRTESDD